VDNPVIVSRELRGSLGLERFWQYDAQPAGAGMSTLTNVANGNMLLRYSPMFAPGRGLEVKLGRTDFNARIRKKTMVITKYWRLPRKVLLGLPGCSSGVRSLVRLGRQQIWLLPFGKRAFVS
jgi:hypothetical protein